MEYSFTTITMSTLVWSGNTSMVVVVPSMGQITVQSFISDYNINMKIYTLIDVIWIFF